MHRLAAPVALAVSLLTIAPLTAQEPTADFVRALRTRYGPRLAEDYLDKLQKEHGTPADPRLLLESARTKLELAATDAKAAEQLANEADTLVKKVLDGNPSEALQGEARLATIQVLTLRGRITLARARRLQGDAQEAELANAQKDFESGGKQIEQTIKQLNEQLAKYKGDPKNAQERQARQALQNAIDAAEFDQALNAIDQAAAVPIGSRPEMTLKRNGIIDKARLLLEKISTHDARSPISYLARAWALQCYWLRDQRDEQKVARVKFDELQRETTPVAEEAQRLAGAFRMQHLLRVMDRQATVEPGEGPMAEAERLGEKWRATYRDQLNTPQGIAVRFILAEAYFRDAESQKGAAAKQKERYEKARELFGELADLDSEYSERARQRRSQVFLALNGGDPQKIESVPLANLKTFSELYDRAQFEARRLADDAARIADPAQLAEQRKKRYENILDALTRALKLAEEGKARVPASDVAAAATMRAYFLLLSGHPVEAIQQGEPVALRKPPAESSPDAAVYVLGAYREVLARPQAYHVADADVAGYQQRRDQLVQTMLATWPTKDAGYAARHFLAQQLHDQHKVPQAIEQLARIDSSYSQSITVHYQLALWCQEADHEGLKPASEDPGASLPWPQRAILALEKMPPLPDNAAPLTAHVYVAGKLLFAQHLYEKHEYDRLDRLAQSLRDGLDRGSIHPGEEAKKTLYPDVLALGLWSAYGRADDLYRSGKYKEAADVLAPVVERSGGEGYVALLRKNADLRKAFLELSLRAFVQDGRTEPSLKALRLLQKAGGDQSDAGRVAALESVVGLIRNQVETLRTEGKKRQLEAAITRFTAFVDEIAKEPMGSSPDFLRLLGECYSSLDKHDKAAVLFAQVPEPAPEKDGKPNPRLLANYQVSRILQVRELRLDGKLDDAEKALAEAKKAPAASLGVELRRQKEELHLLDASDKYADSFPQWMSLVKRLVKEGMATPTSEVYFESYFGLVNACYRYGQGLPEPAKTQTVRKAAGYLVTLQSTFPDMGGGGARTQFQQLLEKEPAFKEQYEQLKTKK